METDDQTGDIDIDTQVLDLDGDGIAVGVASDTDGDGVNDQFSVIDADTGHFARADVGEDGSLTVVEYDPNGEVVHAEYTAPMPELEPEPEPGAPVDGDAVLDPVAPEPAIDDPLSPDLPIDDGSGLICELPIDELADTYTPIEEIEQSAVYQEWVEAQPGGVIGDVSDAAFWFEQGTTYTCAPSAATQIISDFGGTTLADEAAVSEWAEAEGYLFEGEGMYPEGIEATLDHFGVPSTTLRDQGWDDVATYLEEGRSVVMMVDSGDYWPGQDDDAVENADTDGTDHAVRIIGIDPENGTAILSDSGRADGNMFEVPLDDLEEAWNDVTGLDDEGSVERGGRVLVVSDEVDPTTDTTGTTDGAVTEPSTPDDFVDPAVGDVGGVGAGSTPADFVDPTVGDVGGVSGHADTTEDGSWIGAAFANPAGWALIPVVLAGTRVLAAVRRT